MSSALLEWRKPRAVAGEGSKRLDAECAGVGRALRGRREERADACVEMARVGSSGAGRAQHPLASGKRS